MGTHDLKRVGMASESPAGSFGSHQSEDVSHDSGDVSGRVSMSMWEATPSEEGRPKKLSVSDSIADCDVPGIVFLSDRPGAKDTEEALVLPSAPALRQRLLAMA